MIIVEATVFTKQIVDLITDDSYARLQKELIDDPEKGELLEGGGGIRKVRWLAKQGGKSGGIRVIYYYQRLHTIYMIYAYQKNKQEDLTSEQVKIFKAIGGCRRCVHILSVWIAKAGQIDENRHPSAISA